MSRTSPTLSSEAGVNLETGLVERTFWLLAITLGLPVLVLAATGTYKSA